jgi:hypothetical protein
VTKFTLVCSKTPTKEEASSICDALAHPCLQLLSAAKVALFSGAGASLATEILHSALYVAVRCMVGWLVTVMDHTNRLIWW